MSHAEKFLAFLGIGLGIGGAYGFVSTLITELAGRHKEGQQ